MPHKHLPSLALIACLLLPVAAPAVLAADAIQELRAAVQARGDTTRLELPVAAAGMSTVLPITVVSGVQDGPVLLAMAGVHGSEYSPIIATQRLAVALDPGDMSGAVVFLHVANVPAYYGRTVYTSPADQRNLNRSFPGKADGSLTERIAHAITEKLYPLADAVLDMHSGDANEQLAPSWVGYYGFSGAADVIEASRAMAMAFGLQYAVEFQSRLAGPQAAIWGGSAAVMRGIPSIDIEAGGMGIVDEAAIGQIQEGIRRIMAHLGIAAAELPPAPPPRVIRERASVRAPAAGAWVSVIDAGEPVSAGDLLGYLTDLHGRRTFEARSPIDGILLIRLESPPALRGDTLAVVGRAD
jgi:predicted deacylase